MKNIHSLYHIALFQLQHFKIAEGVPQSLFSKLYESFKIVNSQLLLKLKRRHNLYLVVFFSLTSVIKPIKETMTCNGRVILA